MNDSGLPGARAGWDLPDYRVQELGPRSGRHCVCVFVLNEGERIRAQLERMRRVPHDLDVIVADGGSSDGCVDPGLLASLGVRTLLVKSGAGKLSAQMRMALAYALTEGYDGLVIMDGNNKDDPAALPSFSRALGDGFDHVQGSRFLRGGAAINTPWMRLAGVRLLHAPLISLAARFRYTDTTNGFRAYSRRLLLDPRVAPFRSVFSTYELHYYLAIKAARLGYRVTELPVRREYPRHGPTPTKISPIRGSWLVLSVLVRACLHRFDPARSPHSRRS